MSFRTPHAALRNAEQQQQQQCPPAAASTPPRDPTSSASSPSHAAATAAAAAGGGRGSRSRGAGAIAHRPSFSATAAAAASGATSSTSSSSAQPAAAPGAFQHRATQNDAPVCVGERPAPQAAVPRAAVVEDVGEAEARGVVAAHEAARWAQLAAEFEHRWRLVRLLGLHAADVCADEAGARAYVVDFEEARRGAIAVRAAGAACFVRHVVGVRRPLAARAAALKALVEEERAASDRRHLLVTTP